MVNEKIDDSAQFLLKDERPEKHVRKILGDILGFSFDRWDTESLKSPGVSSDSLHENGYRQRFFITWPYNLTPRSSMLDLMKKLACELDVCVLYELGEENEDGEDIWLLVEANGATKRTGIQYLEDGIDVV